MRVESEAIVCAVRAHGEHGAIVRALTPADGLLAGYVRGGRSRRLRPVLIAGNRIAADFRARVDTQLAQLTVDLVESRAALLSEALPAAAIDWATALAAASLPEGQPYPRVFAALDGLLAAIAAAPGALAWAGGLVRYELILLGELGFGLDLSACARTGATADLAYVSPRSGHAVSAAAAIGYEGRLLALPPFLLGGGQADWSAVMDGLALTGHFLARDLLADRRDELLAARGRLVDRLGRAAR